MPLRNFDLDAIGLAMLDTFPAAWVFGVVSLAKRDESVGVLLRSYAERTTPEDRADALAVLRRACVSADGTSAPLVPASQLREALVEHAPEVGVTAGAAPTPRSRVRLFAAETVAFQAQVNGIYTAADSAYPATKVSAPPPSAAKVGCGMGIITRMSTSGSSSASSVQAGRGAANRSLRSPRCSGSTTSVTGCQIFGASRRTTPWSPRGRVGLRSSTPSSAFWDSRQRCSGLAPRAAWRGRQPSSSTRPAERGRSAPHYRAAAAVTTRRVWGVPQQLLASPVVEFLEQTLRR